MNHLSEELMISWINGDLDDVQVSSAKKHINDCNQCLLDFSLIMKSHKEIGGRTFEQAPEHIIKKVKVEMGLEQEQTSGGLIMDNETSVGGVAAADYAPASLILDEPRNSPFFERIFVGLKKPGPALYTAMAVALLILILIPVSFLLEESEGPTFLLEPAPVLMTPTSDEGLAGIKVRVANKGLSISQPIKFKRELKVYNESGELILDTEFERLNNAFTLNEKGGGKLRVVIYSLDEIVYDELVEYNNN